MTPLVLTLDDILADQRENMTRVLRAGRKLHPGSAWIYATGDENPRPKALLLRTPMLADLLQAAQDDGVFDFGIAAMSWTPLLTQAQRVIWLWVELRNVGGHVFTAPILQDDIGDWKYLMQMPAQALHLRAAGASA